MRVLEVIVALLLGANIGVAADRGKDGAVAELLEDNGEALLKLLTNPTGDPGEGHVEQSIVFSGKSGVKIVPMQRFHSKVPGWAYRIAERPGPGEFRYLRFAWRADGCAGIMLQMHDERDWNVRYTAGIDQYGWGTKFVADKPPSQWVVVTCDLFKDFGARTITGIALTGFGGRAAYFDHIYLGRTVEDLDRVDATDARKQPARDLSEEEFEGLWADLANADASKRYFAFWRLVAYDKKASLHLKRKLDLPDAGSSAEQIRQWIRELDSNEYKVRVTASEQLAKHIALATALLEEELRKNPSPEVRSRISRLLLLRTGNNIERERAEKAARILDFIASEAKR